MKFERAPTIKCFHQQIHTFAKCSSKQESSPGKHKLVSTILILQKFKSQESRASIHSIRVGIQYRVPDQAPFPREGNMHTSGVRRENSFVTQALKRRRDSGTWETIAFHISHEDRLGRF